MMRFLSRSLAAPALALALLGLCFGASTASAQVPHDMSYQGRLTDAVGAPLIGPVNLQMRIYDVISGGSALYVEDHTNVSVDDVGAFSVRLGAGSSLLGTFDTALFAGVNRYLEVVVDGAALTPRLIIGSVPYAMHADSAPSAQATADAAQTTADANTAGISANATDVATNTVDISTNTTGISTNATAISGTTTNISTNAAGISTNATAISGATTNISANTSGITANATSIAAIVDQSVEIAALQAQVVALQTYHVATACGNGTVEAGIETCDDGGVAVGDGCSASCAEEPGWSCTGEPSVCSGPARFQACGDGLTVADNETGLLWERKTTTGSVHDVSNTYTWSSTGTAADGTAYTVFLPGLNGASFAGHTDWRLPIISELQSILVGTGVGLSSPNVDPADPAMGTNPTGQATTCAGPPCIDPDFAAVGGPTASSRYWSASSVASNPNNAWRAFFANGELTSGGNPKTFVVYVRAVRAGSCSS